jgi:hypothetical protein
VIGKTNSVSVLWKGTTSVVPLKSHTLRGFSP